MQEQAQHFKTAYEEKIRLLEKEKNELNRMDSKSSAARNLRSKIQQDEADVAQTKAALDESEKTLGKKFKSKMQCSPLRYISKADIFDPRILHQEQRMVPETSGHCVCDGEDRNQV